MGIKIKKSQQKGTPGWMLTMGDMNNLLMCFFIVLMGEDVSKVTGSEEVSMLISSLRGNIGVMEGGRSISKGRMMEFGNNLMTLPSSERKKAYSRTFKQAKEILRPEVLARTVRVREDERGLVITLASDAFFDPGSAAILKGTRPILAKIASIMNAVPNYIRIEGHTDNNPVKPEARHGFETNWELSSARAVNVLRYFAEKEKINEKRLSAVAFGETRPVDDNSTPEGRAYNRRVDIILLKEKEVPVKDNPEISRPLPDEEWR